MNDTNNLETIKDATRKFTLPEFIKPCVSLMLNDNFEGSRDRVAYIIATELRRVGKRPEVTEKILAEWDRDNVPPLGISKIRCKIRSAYKTDYTFGCNNEPIILEYCEKVNKDFCQYHKEIFPQKRIGSDRDFIKYGWQNHLTPGARLVYFMALPELEKRRGLRAGERLFASHREIAKACGVSLDRIGKILEKLADKGLIKYKTGEPYRWRVEASGIQRIIPIPKPKV